MGLFTGKKGMVFGIANDKSIAWAITQKLHEEGAEMGFTHLPDHDPERPKMERRLRKLVEPIGAKVIMPCDVAKDEDVDAVFAAAKDAFGELDFVVHSIAYAPIDDIKGPVYACSRDGFKLSMEISCYSLINLAGKAKDLLVEGGSILTLTYLGGERVIPGYNIMGVCKAALESSIKYLASELGSECKVRVNGLSAGPVKTLAASAVSDHSQMDELYSAMAPLRRNINREEVGKAGMFLLSDLASGITGENLHVDAGFHVMGAPTPEVSGR
ncbi:MAG: enoyl-ACP reductase [Planctomycetota bacterium]|nr:enoyl-ACP reductase [Planctomycetota bacterium]MDA1251414.1 enoyl-ACP reductase [Planctomycetota bacterium]